LSQFGSWTKASGGPTVYEVSLELAGVAVATHRPIVCETWSILAGARHAFLYKERGKEGCSEFEWTVDVTFERVGNAILWKGPRFGPNRVIHACAGTPGIGEGTIRCGDYLPLIRRGEDEIAIGRDGWYLARQACERRLR
jgi:hypothetical protein